MANKYKINIVPIATTDITTVYTCPAENVALVKSISVYNTHATTQVNTRKRARQIAIKV